MTKLIAGPWVGEFGWELFCWQAYLRAIKNQYDIEDMVAVTRPGRELLYEDFCKVETVDIPVKTADSWHNAGINPSTILQKIPRKYSRYEVLRPMNARYYGKPVDMRFKGKVETIDPIFVPLGQESPDTSYQVILHARDRAHRAGDNWALNNWQSLVSYLEKNNISYAFIGSKTESRCLKDEADLRGISLRELVKYLAGAKAIVGPSSGPMHLASLSKCPQLVWSGSDPNKPRYESEWNPFNTRVEYIGRDLGGWQPNPDTVIDKLKNML